MAESNDIEAWEEDLLRRYPSQGARSEQVRDSVKDESFFRDYASEARPSVREFYRLNHCNQTLDFVRHKAKQYLSLRKARMGIWEAMEFLNQLVDDSDPDLDLPQIEHLLQTAEAIRQDGHPDWFCSCRIDSRPGQSALLVGEPQWAVVGDTYPVGCRYSERIVYHRYFRDNPDWRVPEYQTECGVYEPECGLSELLLSWGHDEYLYHVVREYLPEPALAMIRYHSCYPIHREGAYSHLLQSEDQNTLKWVGVFNQYDLYTKRDERMDVQTLRPYYEALISEYFPDQLAW